MFAETNGPGSLERASGAEWMRAAETLPAGASADPGDVPAAAQRRTVDVLRALYWELGQEPPAPPPIGSTRVRRPASDPGA